MNDPITEQKKDFLSLQNVKKTFRIGKNEINVLKGVSMTAAFGEFVALLGASGSGKTTLLDIAGTISTPDSGTVLIDGVDPARLSAGNLVRFRRDYIGFVFQAYHILPELNILENVMLPAMLAGTPRKEAALHAESLLESVNLSHRIKHRPNELSGGEQQRAAIARALINEPNLLLADEPTGNLDHETGREILDLFEKIREKHKMTIVMVTHDRNVASLADRIVQLKNGLITD